MSSSFGASLTEAVASLPQTGSVGQNSPTRQIQMWPLTPSNMSCSPPLLIHAKRLLSWQPLFLTLVTGSVPYQSLPAGCVRMMSQFE